MDATKRVVIGNDCSGRYPVNARYAVYRTALDCDDWVDAAREVLRGKQHLKGKRLKASMGYRVRLRICQIDVDIDVDQD
jgi:hypothetical protein